MGATKRKNYGRFRSAASLLILGPLFLGLAAAWFLFHPADRTASAAAPMPSPSSPRQEQRTDPLPVIPKPMVLAASDPSRMATPAPRKPAASGIVFRGRPGDVAQVKANMRRWLAALKCPPQLVTMVGSPALDEVSFTLSTPVNDTDTFTLIKRLNWPMPVETIAYQDRDDVFQTRELVCEAEVLAAMMQHGRAFVFSGPYCAIERLKEHVAIRRNIVFWGSRADWGFPDPFIPRFNTDLWDALQDGEWTLKSGVSPHQAIADAFLSRPAYELGCKSACQLVMAHGVCDYYSGVRPSPALLAGVARRIDPLHPLASVEAKADRQGVIRRPGSVADRHFNVPWNHWVPGDWGWIKNTDNSSSNEICAEGSNIIYGGGGKFVNYYADGPVRTLDEALKRVYGWRLGVDNGEIELPDEMLERLRGDPRSGGLLRDVRDVPKLFGADAAASPPEA